MKVSEINFLAVVSFILLGSLSPRIVAASEKVNITISGAIKDSTCAVTNLSPTFSLADVTVKDFKATAGTTVGSAEVPITLAGCDANGVSLEYTVSGTADAYSVSTFKNTASGTTAATGVGLYFYSADVFKLLTRPGNPAKFKWNTKADGLTMPFTASYVSTSSTVTAGDFSALVTLDITYP